MDTYEVICDECGAGQGQWLDPLVYPPYLYANRCPRCNDGLTLDQMIAFAEKIYEAKSNLPEARAWHARRDFYWGAELWK